MFPAYTMEDKGGSARKGTRFYFDTSQMEKRSNDSLTPKTPSRNQMSDILVFKQTVDGKTFQNNFELENSITAVMLVIIWVFFLFSRRKIHYFM